MPSQASACDSTQSTQVVRPAKILGKFFSDPPINFFRNLGDLFFSNPRNMCFFDCLFLVFSGVSLETAANFLLFPNVAIFLREKHVSCEDGINFFYKTADLLFNERKGFNKRKQLTLEN